MSEGPWAGTAAWDMLLVVTESGVETGKQVVRDFIEAVWVGQDLTVLNQF